jgi:hypothetical protein
MDTKQVLEFFLNELRADRKAGKEDFLTDRGNAEKDEGLGRKVGCRNKSYPSRNRSHVKENGHQPHGDGVHI